jgi:hypothetical protein
VEEYKKKLTELEDQLRFLHIEIENPLQQCEAGIEIVMKAYEKIKAAVLRRDFKSQLDEIYFFKRIKPQLLSRHIYYNKIYNIEVHKPHGGTKVVKKYLNNELLKLKHYFDDNLEFYKYFRTNADFLDYKYFVRGKYDIKLKIDSYYFETDKRFCTSHDYMVANILSNDQVEVYLETELKNLETKQQKEEQNQKSQVNHKSTIFWTGSKASLIELMYALHTNKCFNNGNVELKQIADFIENTFDIDLGQFNRVFLEIRARKMGRTKFIDSLKDGLIQRMDEADEML